MVREWSGRVTTIVDAASPGRTSIATRPVAAARNRRTMTAPSGGSSVTDAPCSQSVVNSMNAAKSDVSTALTAARCVASVGTAPAAPSHNVCP